MSVQDNHHLLTLLTDPLLIVGLLQGSLLSASCLDFETIFTVFNVCVFFLVRGFDFHLVSFYLYFQYIPLTK